MIRSLLFLCFIFLYVDHKAQFVVFTDNGLQGVKQGNEVILKAKYEQVLMGDTAVFAVYKKEKWEYLSAGGKQIFAKKQSTFLPFRNGYGLVFDPERYVWQAIDATGNMIGEFPEKVIPESFGKLVVFEGRSAIYDLHANQVSMGYNRFEFLSDRLMEISKTVSVATYKKMFGLSVKTDESTELFKLVDITTGTILHEGHKTEKMTAELWYVKGNDKEPGCMIDASGKIIEKDLYEYKVLSSENMALRTSKGTGLFNSSTKAWIVKPDGMSCIGKVGAAYWISSADSSYTVVIQEDGHKKQIQGVNVGMTGFGQPVVWYKDKLALYTTEGEQRTEGYDVIYDRVAENRMVVQNRDRFAYINAQTGKRCSEFYTLYYRNRISGIGHKGKKVITTLATIFATPFSPAIERGLDKHYSLRNYVDVANPPQLFQGGYAIVGIADDSKTNPHRDSVFIPWEDLALHYVFIDSLGKEVSPHYEKAYPFAGQWTWVKTAKGYQRIDKQFKPLTPEFFSDVSSVWDGDYFKVEKAIFKIGLMNSKGEWIAKPIYSMITEKNNSLIGIKDGNETVLVTKQ